MTNAKATTTAETAAVAEQGAQVAPEKAPSKKGASKKGGAPKAKKAANATKKANKAPKSAAKPASKKEAKPANKKTAKAKDGSVPREFSKKAIVVDLLRRKDGATMAEIAKATGWQNHTIRGFISGTLAKKMDLSVASNKNEEGERVYKIEK